jgi:hypothetical protein
VLFLGHVANEKRISTDPSKIEAGQNWPTPTWVKDIRSFLGLRFYYRKFVSKFADIAKPLHKLTELNKTRLSLGLQPSFDILTRALSSPIFSYPNEHGFVILDTDVSNNDLEAVLPWTHGVEKNNKLLQQNFQRCWETIICDTQRALGHSPIH